MVLDEHEGEAKKLGAALCVALKDLLAALPDSLLNRIGRVQWESTRLHLSRCEHGVSISRRWLTERGDNHGHLTEAVTEEEARQLLLLLAAKIRAIHKFSAEDVAAASLLLNKIQKLV